MQPMLQFLKCLNCEPAADGFAYADATHRVSVTQCLNGNFVFVMSSLVGGVWHVMTTVELEVNLRELWDNVLVVLRMFGFSFPEYTREMLVMLVAGIPGAAELAAPVERAGFQLPRAKPRAGASNPGFVGTIKSVTKTAVRDHG